MNELVDENALFKVQYGLYIVTAADGKKLNGQIATTVMQVTYDPVVKISVCLSKNTLTHEMIAKTKKLGVTVLEQATPMDFIGKFGFKSGREVEKFTDVKFEKGVTKVPLVLDHGLVIMEGEVEKSFDIGSHTIFVAELKSCRAIAKGPAMTYEYYYTVMRGRSPENAPTYIKKK